MVIYQSFGFDNLERHGNPVSVGPPLTLTHRLELLPVEVTGYSLMAMCLLAVEWRSVSSPGQWDALGTILMSLPQQHLRLPPFTQGTYGA